MRGFNDFSDLKGAVGTEVGVSDWMEITQDRINKFAEATGDEQWIHIDVERAACKSPGGKTIAHGLLSLSLIPTLIRDIIGLKVVKNTLNYGANRVRYLTPVPAGSRLRGRVEVMAQAAQGRKFDSFHVLDIAIGLGGTDQPIDLGAGLASASSDRPSSVFASVSWRWNTSGWRHRFQR